MRSIALRLRCLVALALAGCSLVNPPSDHVGGELSIEEFCPYYADLGCRAHLDCCPSPAIDYDACTAEWIEACEMQLVPLARDPRTGFSEDAAARVLARGRELAERCDLALADWFVTRDGLQGALVGTVPPGGVCMASGSGLEAAPLWSCNDFAQSCRAGAPEWRCAPRSDTSGSCYIDFDCLDGSYCDALFPGDEGNCRPRRDDGSTCGANKECDSLICESGVCAARTLTNTFCEFRPTTGM